MKNNLSARFTFKDDVCKLRVFFKRKELGEFALIHLLKIINETTGGIRIFNHADALDE